HVPVVYFRPAACFEQAVQGKGHRIFILQPLHFEPAGEIYVHEIFFNERPDECTHGTVGVCRYFIHHEFRVPDFHFKLHRVALSSSYSKRFPSMSTRSATRPGSSLKARTFMSLIRLSVSGMVPA